MTKAKLSQAPNGIITQNFGGDETCVASAISIARLALGYKPALPRWAKVTGKIEVSWIMKNAGRFFPNHKVNTIMGSSQLDKVAHQPLSAEAMSKERGHYLWLFAYTTYSEVGKKFMNSNERYETHIVIGLPVAYDGIALVYAIRVTL